MTPQSTIFLWQFHSIKYLKATINQILSGADIYGFLYERFKFKKMPECNLKDMASEYLGQSIPFGMGGRYTDDTYYIIIEGITSVYFPSRFLYDLMYSVFLHECGHLLKTNKTAGEGFSFSLESEFKADEFLFDMRGKPAVNRLLNDTIRRIEFDKEHNVKSDYTTLLDIANKRKEHIASLHRRPSHEL